jgi:hypothetical protein
MYQLISNLPRGGPEISRNMKPIWVFGPWPGCADMDMNVAGFRMIYHAAHQGVIALLSGNHGLRIYQIVAPVQSVNVGGKDNLVTGFNLSAIIQKVIYGDSRSSRYSYCLHCPIPPALGGSFRPEFVSRTVYQLVFTCQEKIEISRT